MLAKIDIMSNKEGRRPDYLRFTQFCKIYNEMISNDMEYFKMKKYEWNHEMIEWNI